MKVVVVDDYDSFVYNRVQCIGELGAKILVRRDDQTSLQGLIRFKFGQIVCSSGLGVSESIVCQGGKKFVRSFFGEDDL